MRADGACCGPSYSRVSSRAFCQRSDGSQRFASGCWFRLAKGFSAMPSRSPGELARWREKIAWLSPQLCRTLQQGPIDGLARGSVELHRRSAVTAFVVPSYGQAEHDFRSGSEILHDESLGSGSEILSGVLARNQTSLSRWLGSISVPARQHQRSVLAHHVLSTSSAHAVPARRSVLVCTGGA